MIECPVQLWQNFFATLTYKCIFNDPLFLHRLVNLSCKVSHLQKININVLSAPELLLTSKTFSQIEMLNACYVK